MKRTKDGVRKHVVKIQINLLQLADSRALRQKFVEKDRWRAYSSGPTNSNVFVERGWGAVGPIGIAISDSY